MSEMNEKEKDLAREAWSAITSKTMDANEVKKVFEEMIMSNANISLPQVMINVMEIAKAEMMSHESLEKTYGETLSKMIDCCIAQLDKPSITEEDKKEFYAIWHKILDSLNENKKRADEHHKETINKVLDIFKNVAAFAVVIGGAYFLGRGIDDDNSEIIN